MKAFILITFIFIGFCSYSQYDDSNLLGEWISTPDDSTSYYDFLALNIDGSGAYQISIPKGEAPSSSDPLYWQINKWELSNDTITLEVEFLGPSDCGQDDPYYTVMLVIHSRDANKITLEYHDPILSEWYSDSSEPGNWTCFRQENQK